MNLIVPIVGQEAGPQFATDINSSLTIIDQHNHTAGSGVQITPAAININGDLTLNNNSLTNITALTFTAQGSVPTNGSIFVSGVDLHFVDGNGNDVTITTGGAVNATSSGISSGTATASFVAGVLVVNAAANTPANIQGASVLLGNNVANSKYLTLAPPNSMGANYTVTLPALPAQTNVMTLDTSGNMGSVTWNTVADNRTRSTGSTVGAGGVAISSSSGSFVVPNAQTAVTNLSVTITTSGRPVQLMIQPDGSTLNVSEFSASPTIVLYFLRGSTVIGQTFFENGSSIAISYPGFANFVDTPAAGTYTYSIQASNGANNSRIKFVSLVAYEL